MGYFFKQSEMTFSEVALHSNFQNREETEMAFVIRSW